MATNLGTAIGYLTLDITGFTRGIDEATRQIDKMSTSTNNILSTMGSGLTKAGTALTAAVTAPIVGFGASVLREGTTFEEAMTEVKNVANLSRSDINEFRKAMAELGFQMTETGDDAETMYKTMYNYAVNQGSETRFTAEEVAKALYYMGLAGWNAADMVRGLRPVLDLAAASNEDLATVSDIVTDSMKAMGYTAEDTSFYVNVLAEVMRSSNTTVEQIGEAFKYVAPLAGSLGYDIRDVAIALGEFANVGVKGSQAGTGLRQALNSLTNPSEKAMDAMKKYDISIYNADGSAKSLSQVMDMLRDKFGSSVNDVNAASEAYNGFIASVGDSIDELSTYEQGLLFKEYLQSNGLTNFITDWDKAEAVIRLVGIRALPGVLGIINDTDKGFNELSNAIYDAQDSYDGLGSAVGMADELMDTTQGSIYKLTSSISELRIQLFEFLQGPFQQVIDKLTEAIKWFNSLDDSTQRNILNWAGIAAAIGPALLILGKLITGISQISTAFSLAGLSKDKFSKNVTGTLNPALSKGEGMFGKLGTAVKGAGTFLAEHAAQIGGTVTALGGLTLAGKAAVEGLSQGGFKLKQVIETIIGAILVAVGLLVAGVAAVPAIIIGAVVGIVAAIVGNWEKIKELFTNTIIPAVKKFFSDLWEGIQEFFGVIGQAIDNFVKFIFETIPDMLSELFTTIGKWFGDMISSVGKFFSNIGTTLGNWFSNLWDNVSSWFSNLGNSLSNWFSTVQSDVSTLANDIGSTVSSVGTDIMNGISNVFSMIGSGISSLASSFIDIFNSLLSSVMTALSTIGSAIGGFIDNILSAISNTIQSIVVFIGGLAQSIGDALGNVFNAIQSFFENFISRLAGVLDSIGNWISGVIGNLGGFITSLWENITNIVANFGEGISQVLSTIGNGISGLVSSIGKGLGDFLSDIGSTIGSGISSIVDKISGGFSNVWSSVVNIGKNIILGIWDGIKAGVDFVAGGIGNACSSLVDNIKKFFKIGSPSRLMADEVGRWLPPGIVDGFDDALPDAEDDINASLDDMMNDVGVDGDATANIGTSYSELQSILSSSYSAFADAVETTEQRLNASLDSMYEKMYSLTMLNQQLTDGIINDTGYGTAATTVNGATNGINTTNNSTGNTFIFNSPKAIDEIEAARQMEKTQREMEEGFI